MHRIGSKTIWACIRVSLLAAGISACTHPQGLKADALDQNWSEEDKRNWHGATQGSRLIPLDWFEALEQPGGAGLFLDPAYMQQFRYLPSPKGPLPLGFVPDETPDDALSFTKIRWKEGQGNQEQWVGMTCAACHTAQLTYHQHSMQIEGGPTAADFQSFMEAFIAALTQTRDDPAKFDRFAKRVLGSADTDANRGLLKPSFAKWLAFQTAAEDRNQVALRYGYARLDAVGRIFNRVVAVAAPEAKGNPADAPVSYPFLWNVPQHDKVQWDGIAANSAIAGIGGQPFDIGALGRNTGEVIGVFADIQPNATRGLHGFESSTDVSSLTSIEQLLVKLQPPRWPDEILGAPDAALVATGKALFETKCQACHEHLDRTNLTKKFKVTMTPLRKIGNEPGIGTDIWMACNAYAAVSPSGVLEGAPKKYFSGEPLGETAPLSDMLTVMIAGALTNKKGEVIGSAAASFFGLKGPPRVVEHAREEMGVVDKKEVLRTRCMTEDSPLLAYKGRPLTGIWATAPYLHNGSVPTLDDLLLPPDKRPKRFYVGTREFDPVKVGIVTTQSPDNSFLFQTEGASGKPIDGNSNAGHDYGNAQFDAAARKALVEYLKTL